MADVAAVRGTNGLRVASTFSGCGGSCLGFEMAGFSITSASEFVPAARETYEANHPGVPVDGRDVRQVSVDDFLRAAGVERGELDVMEGSPPCAAFSTAGKRSAKWGQESSYSDTKQRSDDLFFEFVRLVDGVRPKVFVAENVSGLVKGVAKGYFKEILRAMQACGYRVGAQLLDAQWLGVPQARKRLIFVGVREDLGRDPAFPVPLPYRYTIVDALPWLQGGKLVSWGLGAYEDRGIGQVPTRAVEDGPCSTIATTGPSADGAYEIWAPMAAQGDDVETDPETGYRISLGEHAIGDEWDRLREGESSDRYFNLVKPDRHAPAPTITAANTRRGVAGITHPYRRRKFTLLELRRLCSFPDDFVLTGTYQQRWERCGRAVPPLMMRAVAEAVRDRVLS